MIANFVVVLNEHNLTSNIVIDKILGIRANPETTIDKNHCRLCFKLLDYVVDNDLFEKFFNSFSQVDQDKILVSDLTSEVDKLQNSKAQSSADR